MTPSSSEAPATLRAWCLTVLHGGDLAAKQRPPRSVDGQLLPDPPGEPVVLDLPARSGELSFAARGVRLPRPARLGDPAARAACLARFAHHELMAVELFAWALVTWPAAPPALRRGMVAACEDEQRHLALYLGRLEAHGSRLGDHALSGYFWKHAAVLRASEHGVLAFLCAMGLTLEQANLDFAGSWADAFRGAGDALSADVLDLVEREEEAHVRLAITWLRRLKDPSLSDVEAYEQAVPFPLSAARAKGRRFDEAARRRAGLSEELIDHVRRARPTYDATAGESS